MIRNNLPDPDPKSNWVPCSDSTLRLYRNGEVRVRIVEKNLGPFESRSETLV